MQLGVSTMPITYTCDTCKCPGEPIQMLSKRVEVEGGVMWITVNLTATDPHAICCKDCMLKKMEGMPELRDMFV